MQTVFRLLAFLLAAFCSLPGPAYADYASQCAGCHGPLSSLPNSTGIQGAIRAANNPAYLKLKIQAGMGGLSIANFSDATIASLASEIGGSPSVAAPAFTSAALPGGTVGTAYN